MINKSIIIIAISIQIIFQFSFIFCTVIQTTLDIYPKETTQVKLLEDIIEQRAYKYKDIYPEKEIWSKTEEQIQQVFKNDKNGSGTKKITPTAPETIKTLKTNPEDNFSKDKLIPLIENKNLDNTNNQEIDQNVSKLDKLLLAKYVNEMQQALKTDKEKKRVRRGRTLQQQEEPEEKDKERETQMWRESDQDIPTQDFKENYSQQGLPWVDNVEKLPYRQENRYDSSSPTENQQLNQESQFANQDAEKLMRLSAGTHPNSENHEWKTKLDDPSYTNNPATKAVQEWQANLLQNERNRWLQEQLQQHFTSLEERSHKNENHKEIPTISKSYYNNLMENFKNAKENVVPTEVTEKVVDANIMVDEYDDSSDYDGEANSKLTAGKTVRVHDEKEEALKAQSSSEQNAQQRKEIILKSNNYGQENLNPMTIENRVRQKFVEIMSNEDDMQIKPKKNEYVKSMIDIASTTKNKIKELLLKQQMKYQTGNQSHSRVKSKNKSLRNSHQHFSAESSPPKRKCVHKCFSPKCEVKCTGVRASAACSAESCRALTRGTDSASLCTGELCHAMCYKKQCIGACEGASCFAKCHGKGCHAVANGQESQTMCTKDDCMTYASGTEAGAKCTGANCQAQCVGQKCVASCDGTSCISGCSGRKCRAECFGEKCRRSINHTVEIEIVQHENPQHINEEISNEKDVSKSMDNGNHKEPGYDVGNQDGGSKEYPDGHLTLDYAIRFHIADKFVNFLQKKLDTIRSSNLLKILPKILA